MAQITSGASSSKLTVETTHTAARTSGRPMDLGVRGAYLASFPTGVLPAALAANSEIFQWRFAAAGGILCLIRSVRVTAAVSTTAFAAGVPVSIEGRIARSWTVAGTGGTRTTFGTNDAKKRSSFAQSILTAADVGVATTAALTVGTKTLDGTPFGGVLWQPGTAVASSPLMSLWERNTSDEYPMLFATGEGFVIRSVAVPATGTWQANITVEWAELDPAVTTGW